MYELPCLNSVRVAINFVTLCFDMSNNSIIDWNHMPICAPINSTCLSIYRTESFFLFSNSMRYNVLGNNMEQNFQLRYLLLLHFQSEGIKFHMLFISAFFYNGKHFSKISLCRIQLLIKSKN